jgi:hypothetical protein
VGKKSAEQIRQMICGWLSFRRLFWGEADFVTCMFLEERVKNGKKEKESHTNKRNYFIGCSTAARFSVMRHKKPK